MNSENAMDAEAAWSPDAPCFLCPRACGAVRSRRPGRCGGGAAMRVALIQQHHGEEPVLSGPALGPRGSGTIFFSGCALGCVYCQNHDISIEPAGTAGSAESPHRIERDGWDGLRGLGREIGVDDLTAAMFELQLSGAYNINLVTAGHYAPLVRQALLLAREHGLTLPVVWNSSSYETVETLRLLDGLVDIYLPDLRYLDATAAARYSGAPDYPRVATYAICEMRRQVGDLVVDESTGLAKSGIIVRVLALPGDMGRADLALDWIADTLGTDTAVSLMGQYYPAYRAAEFPEINRGVTDGEYGKLFDHFEELGFTLGFAQAVGSSENGTPDFRQK